MKIIVGDETGLLKIINAETEQIILKLSEQTKDNSMNFIKFFNDEEVINYE